MSEKDGNDSALQNMIISGSGALGIATGAAVGTLVAGPAGTLIGAATGALLQDGMKSVAGDIASRFTAETERERMGAVYILAQSQVVQRLNDGKKPRSASFFRPRERKKGKILRAEAEELLEGTFLAAQNAFEERKIELLANFYTNVVFRDDLDSSHAAYILSLLESLTYRQLISVVVIGNGTLMNAIRTRDFRGGGGLEPLQVGVLFELYQLVKLDLVTDADASYILGVADINPSRLRLQGTGTELFKLMAPLALDFDDYGYFVNAFQPIH
ncbi:hypothetical protein [Leucobacter alluvii]|uniref:glycine zipper family protein n=1 Tax=Leucobacter alluvii TaxID=340321 RepID=UPI0031F751FF